MNVTNNNVNKKNGNERGKKQRNANEGGEWTQREQTVTKSNVTNVT